MPRKKLKHIAEIATFENVFLDSFGVKKYSSEKYFKNKNPIILELACGKGQYTLALGEKFPNKNFIGIDKKADRIWSGAKKALEDGLKNVAFIKMDIENLAEYFEKGEVAEIWITFPDPQPKPCRADKRLTSGKFLEIYKKVIKKGGIIHLKTDNEKLFRYSVEVANSMNFKNIKIIEDVHNKKSLNSLLEIKTFYEDKFMKEGKPIYYMSFKV